MKGKKEIMRRNIPRWSLGLGTSVSTAGAVSVGDMMAVVVVVRVEGGMVF